MTAIELRRILRDEVFDAPIGPNIKAEDKNRRITYLMSCLTDAVYLDATDPLDKIYGLFALYSAFGVRFPSVDYQQSVAEAYTGATYSLIAWSGSLRLLINACRLQQDGGFPSWVPDWRDKSTRLFMPSSRAAGESTWASHGEFVDMNRLHVRGTLIGSIDSLFMVFPTHLCPTSKGILSGNDAVYAVTDVDFLRLLIHKIRFFLDLMGTFTYMGAEAADAFLDMVTLGVGFMEEEQMEYFSLLVDLLQEPQTRFDLSEGRALADKWRTGDEHNRDCWTTEIYNAAIMTAALVSGSISESGERVASLPGLLDLIKDISSNLADQALYHITLTEQEPILGSAFAAAEPGDYIALLEGAEWPVVLRSKSGVGGLYDFVGPVYVEGIMQGELWPTAVQRLELLALI